RLEQAREHRHRGEEHVEYVERELHAPESERVQQVLEAVGQRSEARRPEQPSQPLERVDGTKRFVDELRIRVALPLRRVQRQEIAREGLDDLLRLGEELL